MEARLRLLYSTETLGNKTTFSPPLYTSRIYIVILQLRRYGKKRTPFPYRPSPHALWDLPMYSLTALTGRHGEAIQSIYRNVYGMH